MYKSIGIATSVTGRARPLRAPKEKVSMQIRYGLLLLAALLLPAVSMAQSVLNVRAEAKGNLVYIAYDLKGSLPGQLFRVTVFSSHNNMQEPLQYVRGDVGEGVSAGSRQIEWGAAKELSRFTGELTFRVQAVLTFSPFALKTPREAGTVYRRGRTYSFQWAGGLANEQLKLELYRDSLPNAVITRTLNTGKYAWEIPVNVQPGDNYRLKVSSLGDPNNYRFSPFFTIKRKIPTVLKIVPLGVAAATGVLLIPARQSGPPEEQQELPEAQGPPR
jgi:hypothetical protein